MREESADQSVGMRAWLRRERAHIQEALSEAEGGLGGFEFGLLIVVAVSLTAMNFLGGGELYVWLWSDLISPASPYWDLGHLTHWVGACVLGYLLIPLLYLRFMGRSVRSLYWDPRPLMRHGWLYLALAALAYLSSTCILHAKILPPRYAAFHLVLFFFWRSS